MSEPMILAMTSTGGVLLLGLGLGLLDLIEVRVANMLPALLFAPLLVAASPLWPSDLRVRRRCSSIRTRIENPRAVQRFTPWEGAGDGRNGQAVAGQSAGRGGA